MVCGIRFWSPIHALNGLEIFPKRFVDFKFSMIFLNFRKYAKFTLPDNTKLSDCVPGCVVAGLSGGVRGAREGGGGGPQR